MTCAQAIALLSQFPSDAEFVRCDADGKPCKVFRIERMKIASRNGDMLNGRLPRFQEPKLEHRNTIAAAMVV